MEQLQVNLDDIQAELSDMLEKSTNENGYEFHNIIASAFIHVDGLKAEVVIVIPTDVRNKNTIKFVVMPSTGSTLPSLTHINYMCAPITILDTKGGVHTIHEIFSRHSDVLHFSELVSEVVARVTEEFKA